MTYFVPNELDYMQSGLIIFAIILVLALAARGC
jgi:hypothetical protein